jgi:hypothetical protein
MITPMNDDDLRRHLIQAAEGAHQKELEREAEFGTFLAAHLGLSAAAANEKAKGLLRLTPADARLLPDDQLNLLAYFALELPVGYSFSPEQIDLAIEHKRPEKA